MDYLWTPWRFQFVSSIGRAGSGCVFCELPAGRDEEAHIVFRGGANYVVLNRYPYTSGHLMVVPFRHFGAFHEMGGEESSEALHLARLAQLALLDAYRPEGFNIGWNQGKCAGAGVADHLHLHVVPRWVGDANFVSVFGETRVLPESLDETFRKLADRMRGGPRPSPPEG